MQRNVCTAAWTADSYVEVQWMSACDTSSCVQVDYRENRVRIRDGKLGDESPVIEFTVEKWYEFAETVLCGGIPDDAIELIDGGIWLPVDGFYLKFDAKEWDEFVEGVRNGTFDLEVRRGLRQLDGTVRSRVALRTGLSPERLDELGGFPIEERGVS